MRTIVGLGLAFVVLLDARIAAAEETPRSMFTQHPTALLGVVSHFGSPTGHLGLVIDHSLSRWLAIEGGFGAGAQGPQIAAGARLHIPVSDRWAFGPGVSISYGKYKPFCFFADCSVPSGNVTWSNFDLAAEIRFHTRVALRFAFGVSVDEACAGSACRRSWPLRTSLGERNTVLPFTSVGVGYAW